MSRRSQRSGQNLASRLGAMSPRRLRVWVRNHVEMAGDSWRRLLAEPAQTAMTVAVIAIALALPAVLLQLSALGKGLVSGVEVSADINAYFSTQVGESRARELASGWQQDSRVASLRLISPDEGLADFERHSGLSALLGTLSSNPLPWVARVTPADQYLGNSAELRLLAQTLSAAPEVEAVEFDSSWIERLAAILVLIERLSLGVGALLAAGVVLVIGNTVRLAIESRRDEITILKLVGGTDRFVRRPLLYTGFWYGLAGGGIAALLLGSVGLLLGGPLHALFAAYQAAPAQLPGLSLGPLGWLLGLGGLLGWLGALIAATAHLRRIEPS